MLERVSIFLVQKLSGNLVDRVLFSTTSYAEAAAYSEQHGFDTAITHVQCELPILGQPYRNLLCLQSPERPAASRLSQHELT